MKIYLINKSNKNNDKIKININYLFLNKLFILKKD